MLQDVPSVGSTWPSFRSHFQFRGTTVEAQVPSPLVHISEPFIRGEHSPTRKVLPVPSVISRRLIDRPLLQSEKMPRKTPLQPQFGPTPGALSPEYRSNVEL